MKDAEFRRAKQFHEAGRLAEAERAYRAILSARPSDADALHMLGLLAHQAGHSAAAIDLIVQSLRIWPGNAAAEVDLAAALQQQGRLPEALAANDRALAIDAKFPPALNNRANVLRALGRLPEAIAAFRRAIEIAPGVAAPYINLGDALKTAGQSAEAIAVLRRAIEIDPNIAEAWANLGDALNSIGELDEAAAACRRAVELKPTDANSHNTLGNVEFNRGNAPEALAAYQKAVELDPGFAQVFSNIGNVLKSKGRLSEAEAAYRRSLEIMPDFAGGYLNLGNVLWFQSRIAEASAAYRKAMELNPDMTPAHSGLVLTTNFDPSLDGAAILLEHRRWAERHLRGLPGPMFDPRHNRSPDRRLRIGYASGDFRDHSVTYFLENALKFHDAEKVEIFCYSDTLRQDAVTERFKKLANWRHILAMTHLDAARQMARDRIDIMVDLAGHTAGNRLMALACKPAPVQVTWLGYPATTGVSAIDYRLTDAYADPPGMTEAFHVEELVRLPDTFLCYRPPEDAPPVEARKPRPITFGSFNHLPKVNGEVLDNWARILNRVPGSWLLLKALGLGDPPVRKFLLDRLAAGGVAEDRVEFIAWLQTVPEHMQLYDRVDIALDTFPYNGTTTTCEALWMGTPVVTLAGDRHGSRVGVSILSNVGAAELIANSGEDYVRIATELAGDEPRLAEYRRTLREKMQRSPLMDGPRFAGNLEAAYRWMWKQHCGAI